MNLNRIISNDKYVSKTQIVFKKEIIQFNFFYFLCRRFMRFKAKIKYALNFFLNKKNINTINFGVAFTGPLVSLAILREYGNCY